MTDFLSALRLYLLSQRAVMDLVDRSIYVMAIPAEELEQKQPHKIVVLVASGGPIARGNRVMTVARVDVVCYGETDFEAAALERPVAQALKDLSRVTIGGVLLHSVMLSGAPFQARDPDLLWPAVRRQTLVRADEREVS